MKKAPSSYNYQETIRQKITNEIIASIEAGTPIWRKPWVGGALPTNLVSKKRYRGINTLLLGSHQMRHQLRSTVYATFNQWKDAGCPVRRRPENLAGDYGATIVYFSPVTRQKENREGKLEDVTFPLLKTYAVFNADQTEGGAELVAKNREKALAEGTPEANAERIANAYLEAESIAVLDGDKALYSPSQDTIVMPPASAFVGGIGSYFATLFHEIAHSTGNEKRLNRLSKFARFGDEAYALEELVAELASSFLCGAAGSPNGEIENHASYLGCWLKVLKRDSKAIFNATSAASLAADLVLTRSEEESDDGESAE